MNSTGVSQSGWDRLMLDLTSLMAGWLLMAWRWRVRGKVSACVGWRRGIVMLAGGRVVEGDGDARVSSWSVLYQVVFWPVLLAQCWD